MKGILGTKVGMTRIYKEDRAIPVTVILAGPCPVVQRRTPEKDGYLAVQLGFLAQKPARVNRPMKGHFAKAGVQPVRILKEIRDFNPEADMVTVEIFQPGERVDVTGTSKGRGTAGVMKRWNFAGVPILTGPTRSTATRAPSATARPRAAFTRARRWRAITGRSGSRCRTSRWWT